MRKPTFPGCKSNSGFHHVQVPWTCRHCNTRACASCAHHFGTSRSAFTLRDAGPRLFTCGKCSQTLSDSAKGRVQ